jgi:hypothetical protein
MMRQRRQRSQEARKSELQEEDVDSYGSLEGLRVCCADCKPIIDPSRKFNIGCSSRVWKSCERCGVKTLYRLRPVEALGMSS